MPKTPTTIRTMVDLVAQRGVSRKPGVFVDPTTGAIDVSAAAYVAVTGTIPAVFTTDPNTARDPNAPRDLIEANPDAMAAIIAISDSLDTEAPVTEVIADGQIAEVAEHIEHLAAWTDRPGIGETAPPTDTEVIGRLLRLADQLDASTRLPHAA